MFHPKTCPWNTRNSNSSLLSARLQRQKTISKPRGTGLWSRDVLHLLTNDVMKLCRDNCHALAWNDWNDWVLLYLIPLIYIYHYISSYIAQRQGSVKYSEEVQALVRSDFFGASHRCHLFSIRKFSVGNSRGFLSFPPSFHHTLIGLCLRRILWVLLVDFGRLRRFICNIWSHV